MAAKCRYFWKLQSGVVVNHMKFDSRETTCHKLQKIPLVYVIIPGNPGCIQFYEKFSEVLHKASRIPVWGVSHTGHMRHEEDALPHPSSIECGLEKQIQRKIEYLDEEVFPYADKVILIGHSIGCFIILKVLERMKERESSFLKSILLFPTIENMSVTPQGIKMTPLLSKARWFFMFAVGLVKFLPKSVLSRVIPLFVKSSEDCIHRTIVEHFNWKVTDCVTYMALHEMYEVNERADNIIEKNIDKLIFYYGAKDGWCPVSYFEDVYKQHAWRTGSDIQLCSRGMPHAFVLTHSSEMAEVVAEWTANLSL